MSKIKTEIVVFSVESAIAAQTGGANRVELCENMAEGGTTPSQGTIKTARKYLDIDLNVIIRPRGADFLYSEIEFEIMKSDIAFCKASGVDGVVFGILDKNGDVDKERCKQLVDLAKPMSATFHRAFDMTRNPLKALEDTIACGFDRILSSGQQQTANQGVELLSELVEVANNRIIIMPGGGVRSNNIKDLIEKTKAKEFHTSARITINSKMKFHQKMISMGGTHSFNEFEIQGIDSEVVRDFTTQL
jgi:copper homeostasis protein